MNEETISTENPMIDHYLKQLQESWDFTEEQLLDIKSKIAQYAICCCIDHSHKKEAFKISGEKLKSNLNMNC